MQDIHTHLYWESYDVDRDEVIRRAREVGVKEMIVVGTTVNESKKAISLSQKEEGIFASIGIHPNEFRGTEDYESGSEMVSQVDQLRKLVEENREVVVAIGECGLDYSLSHGVITDSDKLYQRELFEKQLVLAETFTLPVIIHCRAKSAESDEAYWDLLEILKEWQSRIPAIVLHCYMGSANVTKEFLSLSNVYFSFTGNITYPVKKDMAGGEYDLTEVVKLIPLEKIFTETDCPFLAPQESRGNRNEPAFVVAVAEKIAELQNSSLDVVEKATAQNFKHVFTNN